MNAPGRIMHLLTSVYGEEAGAKISERLKALLAPFSPAAPVSQTILSHADAFLITYGDQVTQSGLSPLQSLGHFCKDYLKGIITVVHVLPFYPYSSDDGFSVIDYREVDPLLGSWADIAELGSHFRLMFDAVINHVSARHEWFEGFLQNHHRYSDYFIEVKGDPDLSRVVRPRTHPVLTEFNTTTGCKRVWTTFSADQVDLNFRNPEVLLEIVDLLLFYISRGAAFLRLDAIAYLWKEIGTSCIHLPQTHAMIKLFRAVLEETTRHVFLITETNVAHEENLSYFGDGSDEAQMVYNFALPPMLLHTFRSGNSRALMRWAASLKLPSDKTTYFNFLASHDGIGVNPVRGILEETEIDEIVRHCLRHGGLVSHKTNPDGTESPYELNINYFDALSNPQSNEDIDLQVARFIGAHRILLSLIGVPALYFHSLFGSRSWLNGPAETGRNRSINREKLQRKEIEAELRNPESLRYKVYKRLSELVQIRSRHPAFDPYGKQKVLECDDSVFALVRESRNAGDKMLCVQNVTSTAQTVNVADRVFQLSPYEGVWLKL